jgi:hypothetical protein
MESFVAWLFHSPVSQALQRNEFWMWPLCETLHFAGLAVLIGVAGLFDLRLLGVIRRVPVAWIKEMMPIAMVAFAVNAVTGVIFLLAEPQQYMFNTGWWLKFFFLALAGANALVFETRFGRIADALRPGDPSPLSLKIVGAVSLTSWMAVLYFGRMLPYLFPNVNSGL